MIIIRLLVLDALVGSPIAGLMQFVMAIVMMACVGVGLAHLRPDRVRPSRPPL